MPAFEPTEMAASERSREARLAAMARTNAWVALAISALVFAGWFLSAEPLKGLLPESAATKANSAFALCLCSLALIMYLQEIRHRAPTGARVLAGLAGLIGTATLIEHTFGLDLRIDQVIAAEPQNAFGTSAPGRMGPSVAICLILFAAGINLVGQRTTLGSPTRLFAFVVMVVGLVAGIGYAADVPQFTGPASLTQMALPEALACMLLGMALLIADPEDGVARMLIVDSPGGTVARRLLPAALITAPVLGLGTQALEDEGLLSPEVRLVVLVCGLIAIFASAAVAIASSLDLADDERRQAEERFRSAFEHAPLAMAVTDTAGVLEQVNAASFSLFGSDTEALVGSKLTDFVKSDHRSLLNAGIDQIIEGESEVFRSELRVATGARKAWTEISLTGVRDTRGRVARLVAQMQDITDRRQYQDQLEFTAHHDALTGLLNKASFAEELDRHSARWSAGRPGAVVALDLDGFKAYNDTFGHAAGDELLTAAAERMRAALRSADIIARLGGDEFAVLLPTLGLAEGAEVANKLVESVSEMPMRHSASVPPVTVSAGVSVFDFEGMEGEAVLVNADLAMYEAKMAGRNRVEVHEGGGQAGVGQAQMGWIERIREALSEDDQLELYAQPILDLQTRKPVYHEVLLRMRSDSGELIPPAAFLPFAERFGLLGEIDHWLVARVLSLMDRSPTPLEINLSPGSLGDEEMISRVEAEVSAAGGGSREKLIFAVSEHEAIENLGAARAFGHRLRSSGCQVALDGYGSGFGSFQYLKSLPADILKIQGEFVRNCADDESDRIVIETIARIAKHQGMKLVAEHVPNERTVEVLRKLGIRYGQGFFLGDPVPIDQILRTPTGRSRRSSATRAEPVNSRA